MIDWRDMQAIKYRGDLARFHTEWTETLLDLRNVPDEIILHDWYRENIEKEADLKLVMQNYEYDLNFKEGKKDLEQLYRYVELELEVRHKKRIKKGSFSRHCCSRESS